MDDDLFTYEVEVANILCDSNMDDDLEHKADDDIGYDPSDVAFTELLEETMKFTGEESSDNKDDVAEVFRIDTNIFDYETPLCLAFNEFNYLLKVDLDILTKDIMRATPLSTWYPLHPPDLSSPSSSTPPASPSKISSHSSSAERYTSKSLGFTSCIIEGILMRLVLSLLLRLQLRKMLIMRFEEIEEELHTLRDRVAASEKEETALRERVRAMEVGDLSLRESLRIARAGQTEMQCQVRHTAEQLQQCQITRCHERERIRRMQAFLCSYFDYHV
ncbi:hypothetical protein Tco_0360331 [Tanacetum coccineum]